MGFKISIIPHTIRGRTEVPTECLENPGKYGILVMGHVAGGARTSRVRKDTKESDPTFGLYEHERQLQEELTSNYSRCARIKMVSMLGPMDGRSSSNFRRFH